MNFNLWFTSLYSPLRFVLKPSGACSWMVELLITSMQHSESSAPRGRTRQYTCVHNTIRAKIYNTKYHNEYVLRFDFFFFFQSDVCREICIFWRLITVTVTTKRWLLPFWCSVTHPNWVLLAVWWLSRRIPPGGFRLPERNNQSPLMSTMQHC